MALLTSRGVWGLVAGAVPLAMLPSLGLADSDLSFLYLIFFWVALATSWGILSGYAGYWSFGHAAFYGVGVYATATLTTWFGLPFLATIPVAAALAAALALGIGLVVFRSARLRGEFFALLTLSVAYVVATIVSNTPLDNGAGVNLGAVKLPDIGGSAPATLYLLGLGLAFAALLASYLTAHSAFGMGLAAIHDDEDAAEVKGVPTRTFKLAAFALSSAIAGAVGAVQAVYVGYVTVGETFSINVPLYVVLMSILGGARRWMGPAVGAALITIALNMFTSSGQAELGRAGVALALVVVILVLPEGIVPALDRAMARLPWRSKRSTPAAAPVAELAVSTATRGALLLDCRDVAKSFGGIKALRGVTLDVRVGEILALVGPNGSGKSTLINTISGHFPATSGSIAFDGRTISTLEPHRVARAGVARTYQIPRLFDRMSALDNVALCAVFTRGLGRQEARIEAQRWLAITGLSALADRFPPHLNLHERKFLEFARALAARPRLLLLDEVLCGLTPTEVDSAILLIRRIRDAGTTIVFVEHLMRVVVALSDRVAVLDQGMLIALGAPGDTMRDPKVVSVYLGKAHAA